MRHAEMFPDPMHVRKNLSSRLSSRYWVGILIYEKALYAPSVPETESVKLEIPRSQAEYLCKFNESELYRVCFSIRETIVTS